MPAMTTASAAPDCGQSALLAAVPTTVVPTMISRDHAVNDRVARAVVLHRALNQRAAQIRDQDRDALDLLLAHRGPADAERYFRDLGWSAHVPRAAQELALKVQSAQEKLTTKTGRSPTVYELAQYLELSIEDALEGLEAAAAHHSSSLDLPRDDGDGESGTLADTFGQEDAGFQLVEDAATVATAMQTLSERERRVLQLRFFQDHTQSEIAKEIGVSQMQISRILRRALTALNERALPRNP
jgi:RNA polymerase sigma factor (sigma-70 family)